MNLRIEIETDATDPRPPRRFVLRASSLPRLFKSAAFLVGSLLCAALILGWYVAGSVGNGPSAREENSMLRARLHAMDTRLALVDAALERVMGEDAKLRELSREDEGAQAFGIGPLKDLETAAAERDGEPIALAGPQEIKPPDATDLDAVLDDMEIRARRLEASAVREEKNLQEVRGYLDDRTALLRSQPSAWPVRGWLTSRFGWREGPSGGGMDHHSGIDISAPRGTTVVAPGGGFVVFAGYHPGYGNLVVLDHGYGITTRHGHLSVIDVAAGTRIQRGELLGRVGNTGRSTGPHLHFEVLRDGVPVNPLKYLADLE